MNVPRATMDPDVAQEKLEATERVLERRADDPELLALRDAYAAAADGKPLIQLSLAISNAPRDRHGRPQLAIARADRRHVTLQLHNRNGVCEFSTVSPRSTRRWHSRSSLVVEIPWPTPNRYVIGHALVPLIPPDVLETVTPRDLRGYHILFEVEAWADEPLDAQPDRDPYLLRHVTGDLWAIIAEWDLTDIERAVMAARARE